MCNTENIFQNNKEINDKNNLKIIGENEIIGDIDELIFPEDEPYYISER